MAKPLQSEEIHKKLNKYIANIITLLRIPLTIVFIYKFYYYWTSDKGTLTSLLFLLLLIYLTDLSDGKIARKLNIVSKFGTYLDVYVDLFHIISCLIMFNVFNLVPIWFTIIVVLKFVEFNVTSYIVKKYSYDKPIFMFDKLGRLVCAAYYVVPFFACILSSDITSNYKEGLGFLLIIILIGTIVSSLARSIECIKINKYNNNQVINAVIEERRCI